MSDDAAEAAILAAARADPPSYATHKLWKARCEAFDALAEACRAGGQRMDESTVDLIVSATGDANAAAQDKALDALIAFLDRPGPPCPVAGRVAPAAAATLAAKALKGRPATLARASVACLLLVEHGGGEAVTAGLVSAFKDKVPKVPAAALGVLSAAVVAYGPAPLDLPTLFGALPPLFEARAGPVRDAAKKLAADLAGGLGLAAIGPALLARIPDAARKEVEKAVEEGGLGGVGPTRQTRAAAAAAAAAAVAAAAAAASSTGDVDMADVATAVAPAPLPPPAPVVDAFALAPPTDLAPALGKAFHTGMASAKWSDRRAALQKLVATASAPRLVPGCPSLADGVRELRKVLATDSNAACVAEAAAAVGALGAGLRRDFAGPARVLVPALLDKLKDKNTGVALASAAAAKALLIHCVPLGEAADEVAAVVAHKNPASRAAALRLVAGVAEETPAAVLSKAAFPALLPAAAKAAADAVPDVRDAAVAALAAVARCSGGAALLDRLGPGALDGARRKKVEAAMSVGPVAATAAAPGRRPGTGLARPAATAAAAGAGAPPPRPALSPRSANLPPAAAVLAKPLGVRPPAGRAPPGRTPARRPGAVGGPAAAGGPASTSAPEEDCSSALTRTDAEDRLAALLGPAKVAALQSPDWKARLDAMDAVAAAAGGCEVGPTGRPYTGPPDLVQCLAHIPGWGDKNFQVTARVFHVMAAAAAGAGSATFTRRDAAALVDGAAEKLADAKVRPAAAAALDAAAEAVGPAFVAARLHARAAVARNPRVLVEADAWIGRAVTEFGLAPAVGWDVRAVVGALKADLAAAAPAVRAAAVAALAALHAHLGSPLADMVRPDVKPALMVTLDAAFAAYPAGSAPAPAAPCLAAAPGKDVRLRRAVHPPPSSHASEEAAVLADLIPLASPELGALLTAGTPAAAAEAAALVAAQAAGGRAGAGAVAASDLLLRWAAARLSSASSTPAHALVFLGMATEVFRALGRAGGRLTASEAGAVLPALVTAGLGSPREAVRRASGEALTAASAVTAPFRVLDALAGGLAASHPPRLRAEALVAMADLVQCGAAAGLASTDAKAPRPFVPVAAAATADPDLAVRNAALDALAVLVAVEGPGPAWVAAGPMAAEVRAAVEARVGGVGGGAGVAAAAPAPAPAPPPPAVALPPPRRPAAPAAAAAAATPTPPHPSTYRIADTPAAQRRPCPLAAAGSAPTPLPPPTPAVGGATPTPPGLTPGVALVMGQAAAGRASVVAAAAAAATAGAAEEEGDPPDDPVAAWAAALADMGSHDLATAVEGMKAACYEMMDAVAADGAGGPASPALAAMASSADALVAGLAARADQAFSLALADARGGLAPPSAGSSSQQQPRGVRAAKYALNALLHAFDLQAVGRAVGGAALRDAAGVLLATLLDAGLLPAALGPDGAALVKAVNVLMLRLLAGADRATAVDALLALLARPPAGVAARDAAAAAAASSSSSTPLPSAVFADLVIKCLIKLARTLDVDGRGALDPAVDPAALLASAHAWFHAVGPAGLAGAAARAGGGPGSSDRPLRAVQTLVHEVCRLTPGGPAAVRAALGRALGPAVHSNPPPAVVAAVEANLAALEGGAGAARPPQPAAASASPAPPPSPATELASIFRAIGVRETSEGGLDRLARHIAAAPPGAINLAPHLSKTSPHFRAYIASGLARAAGRLGLGSLPPCGVEGLNGMAVAAAAAAAAPVAPPDPAPPAPAPAPPAPSTSLESLRARLARVRLAGRPSVGGGGVLEDAAAASAPSTEALAARMQALRREGR